MLDPLVTSPQPERRPNEFGIRHQEIDERTCLVAVEGDLDLASAPELKWTLVELLHKGYSHYVIDLSALTHMDSMGLGVLVGFRKRLHADARLAIACMPRPLTRLLEMTGVDACLGTFASVDEALGAGTGRGLPLDTDAAMALGLASTAMPFATSRRAEALRWLRILRLNGEAARVLSVFGVGETLPAGVDEETEAPLSTEQRADGDAIATITDLAGRIARRRGATAVGTGDILVAVIQFYSPDFDVVLAAHGTDRDEVIGRLAA
ncbi:MAG TPA: STAS domain-containing protein [Solirubrobacteraceae bacterium]|nr:STAS domain-containing protein [Solirubrobacteraceae bacterium]